MGLFSWLLEKRPRPAPAAPRPKVISGLDDHSTHVVVEIGNAVMMMDREQFDRLYGENHSPDPTQGDLDRLLPKVTRVRVIAGGMFRGKAMSQETLIDTSQPGALIAFRKTLVIDEDPTTFSHCACLGGPTLELFTGEKLAATIGLQHGRAIRWKQWKNDANLRDGQALNDWLTRNGIVREFLDLLLNNQYDAGGLMPLGLRRSGSSPLSPGEQRVRLAELSRVRGGNLEAALASCQKILDDEPDLAFGHAVRALIHSQRKEYARSAEDCTEAIRLGLREAEVYFARAVARDILGQAGEAELDCTKAIEIEPTHANAFNSRGLIRTRLGRIDEALRDFGEAIRLAPAWGLAHMNRVQAHLARNDWDAAIADCDRVIGLLDQPDCQIDQQLAAAAFANRGRIHQLKGNDALAAADFQKAERMANKPLRSGPAVQCPHCKGSGDCYCKRKGWENSDQCRRCGGTGECHACKGSGFIGH